MGNESYICGVDWGKEGGSYSCIAHFEDEVLKGFSIPKKWLLPNPPTTTATEALTEGLRNAWSSIVCKIWGGR